MKGDNVPVLVLMVGDWVGLIDFTIQSVMGFGRLADGGFVGGRR